MLAPPEGLEPPAIRVEAGCSIQLSYGGCATMWRLWPGATPACQHHTICLSSHLHEGGAVAANAVVALSESWLDRFPQRVCFPRRTISTSLHPRSVALVRETSRRLALSWAEQLWNALAHLTPVSLRAKTLPVGLSFPPRGFASALSPPLQIPAKRSP